MEEKNTQVCEDGICSPAGATQTAEPEVNVSGKIGALIYFGDPMCSWCWGLTKHLSALKKEFQDQLDFEMIMGGLRPGGGDLWDDNMTSFLREHWEHVEEASGQPFNYDLLERKEFNYDTEPPARAVRVIRDLKPEKELDFYESIQNAFYVLNGDPGTLEFYEDPCKNNDIDYSEFQKLFQSEEYKRLVRQDFQFAQQLGVRGFPSVVLQQGANFTAISMGYSTFDKMNAKVKELISVEKMS